MVATDIHGKGAHRIRLPELRKSMTLPFLLKLLIFNFNNFCYIFTLHHCSAISWNFDFRLICLNMGVIFLFVSVILFAYDSDQYGTAATSGEKLLMTIIYGFQTLSFTTVGFVWDVLAAPIHLFFFTFLV